MKSYLTSFVLAGLLGAMPLANAMEGEGGGDMASHEGPAEVYDGVLVGADDMTLYVFDKDMAGSGKSVCNGPCAANWPPFMAESGDEADGDYTIVARDDGSSQWAYKGKPLYYWVKDKAPGDMTGDGVKGVWHVARP